MSPLSIRPAREDDAALIADLSQVTFVETYAAYNTKANIDKFLAEQFTLENLAAEVFQPWHTFLVAYLDEEAVGYVKLRDGAKPLSLSSYSCVEIARIYCLQKVIGKGVGSELMTNSIHFAKQKSKDILWLGVWPKNERALTFYTKWGFEKFDEQEFLLGDDLQTDWLMRKSID